LKPLKLASIVILSLLLCPLLAPLASALPEQSQNSVQIVSVKIVGSIAIEQIIIDGTLVKANATIYQQGQNPYVYYQGSYAQSPEYIGNTPYTWFTGISNPPEVYVYLQPLTAISGTAALGALAILIAGIAAIPSGGLGAVAAGLVSGLLSVDYNTIYGADHNSDNSMSMWIPVDWFNVAYMFELSHALYIATPRYWWLATIGAYAVANR
jgi:hypothetical protein